MFRKKLDIQLILQLSGCLSVTNISKHMFFTCDFMLQHKSFLKGKSLNLKTCINLKSIFIYMDIKKSEILYLNKVINGMRQSSYQSLNVLFSLIKKYKQSRHRLTKVCNILRV